MKKLIAVGSLVVSMACADKSPMAPTGIVDSRTPRQSMPVNNDLSMFAGFAVRADGTTTVSDDGPDHIEHPVRFPMWQGLVAFPPRDQPNSFFAALQRLYRDELRRPQTAISFVDPEGQNVWLTEYFRFYLNGCSHEDSVSRTLQEITTGTTLPTCGAERLEFPPRNLPNAFQAQLEATYRDVLRRPQMLSYVDSEGANVWLAQYLRFRVAGNCDHLTAQNKVFTEIRGGGVQPTCHAGPRTSFGPGQYRVNTDIAPGRYFADPVSGCYWERLRGFGGSLSDILANDFVGFNAGQIVVDILPSDLGFSTDSECGTWSTAPRAGPPGGTITPGTWLVGAQIAPGTYSAATRAGCYWERLRDFTGTLNGIIANDFVSSGGMRFVTIGAGDAGFNSDADCGNWSRAGSALTIDGGESAAMTQSDQSPAAIALRRNAGRRHSPAPKPLM